MTTLSDTNRAIFAERRARLAALMPPGSVALFPSAPIANRNNDVDHEYRQDSDLFYLSGFEEPESLGVLKRDDDGHSFEMVVRPKDREREIWDGRRAGVEGAVFQARSGFAKTEIAWCDVLQA